ncbi:hypothetical protein V5799_027606 [Amblyomma americanum]|uniref:Uncharacterized protein n=1 Tax=Amblyomma americanum TaxID=6943 RepID=A0AAQ4DF92_AMBAM
MTSLPTPDGGAAAVAFAGRQSSRPLLSWRERRGSQEALLRALVRGSHKFWDSNVTGVQVVVYGPGDPVPAPRRLASSHTTRLCNEVWDSSQVFEYGVVSKQGANWVSHLTEFVVPPLAGFMRDKFRARCYGVWNFWHDDFAGVCGGGPYPLMRNLFGVFSERR